MHFKGGWIYICGSGVNVQNLTGRSGDMEALEGGGAKDTLPPTLLRH